jgi:Ca2+/Na+ antiporter
MRFENLFLIINIIIIISSILIRIKKNYISLKSIVNRELLMIFETLIMYFIIIKNSLYFSSIFLEALFFIKYTYLYFKKLYYK